MRLYYSLQFAEAAVKFPFQFISVNGVEKAPVSADDENRDIKEILADYIIPFDAPAARVADLAGALRENKPRIVHFIGHGNRFKELMFLDDKRKTYGADRNAIEAIFGMHHGDIRLVVLNACYSQQQAAMISEHVESVIGVNRPIDDDIATQYARTLYRILRTGQSVKDAHDEAVQVVMQEKRVPQEQWPVLTSRATGSRAIIFPPANPELEQLRNERKTAFEAEKGTCGISIDSFSLYKETSPDGTSTLHYDVQALRVSHNERISGFYFQLETTAGLVYQPKPTGQSEKLIYWDPPKDLPAPTTLPEVIKSKSSVKGVFRFRQKLSLQSGPYSFGWSVKVHNMDAFTRWEFDNLYPSARDRRHVDGSPLKPPVEYIARLVWLPLGRLTLRLKLLPAMPEVNFRCFDWVLDKKIDKASVLTDGLLCSMPLDGLGAGAKDSPWEARPNVDALEGDLLYIDANQVAEISISHPRLGSWYSLDWSLTDQRLYGFFQELASDAAVIRARLTEHRNARLVSKTTRRSPEILRFLRELHQWLREQFPKQVDEELFETTLFSYDIKLHQVVVCESVSGDEGVQTSELGMSFGLPFGMGLAGACFRAGNGVLTYHDNGPDGDEPEFYLPNPGQSRQAYLMALPIDHPDFTLDDWKKGKIERSRQLAGVITIGSNYEASALREMCVKPPEQESEYEPWKASLEAFRNDCQRRFDPLSNFFLGRAGGSGKKPKKC